MPIPIMERARRAVVVASIAAAGTIGFCSFAMAAVDDSNITDRDHARYLKLVNCGAYTIKNLYLNYKVKSDSSTGDVKEGRILVGTSIKGWDKVGNPKENVTCVDVKDNEEIPDGAEIWLSYRIEAGQREDCRKSHRIFYSAASTIQLGQRATGATSNNNNCVRTFRKELGSDSECRMVSKDRCRY